MARPVIERPETIEGEAAGDLVYKAPAPEPTLRRVYVLPRDLVQRIHEYGTADDIRRIRGADRQGDKHSGVIRPKQSVKSRGFPPSGKARSPKPPLPPRQLYEQVSR